LTYNKLDKVLKSDLDWDVILIGGNNLKPYTIINDDLVKISNCQTSTAYIIKANYYDKLIKNLKEGYSLGNSY